MDMKEFMIRLKGRIARLSFRTGLVVLGVCVLCYALSFAQMLLPISVTAKGVLWTLLFGLANACQYAALVILGKEGINRIRARLKS